MATASDALRVEGLQEFLARVKEMQVQTPTRVTRQALNQSAEIVARYARPKTPTRSGRARGSVRVSSTATSARISGGGARVPYFGWLDYGGAVGRHRSVKRPVVRTGRILYPAFHEHQAEVQATMSKALRDAADRVGLRVTS